MARARRKDEGWGPLAVAAAAGLWGFRFELALVAAVVIAHAWLASLVGGVVPVWGM
jgi:hypothetical protein